MLRARAAIAAAMLSFAVIGCRSSNTFQNNGPTPQGAVTLNVNNQNLNDMELWVVAQGLATRLGVVSGLSKDSFVLAPSFFPSTDLRIVATPIGGNGRAWSDPLSVAPGQTIDFQISPQARLSTATVH